MGEYARVKGTGERIKLGTCEDLYYLRFDQLDQIWPGDHEDTDVRAHLDALRFRFPFPDEDSIEPGNFDAYDRGHRIYGVPFPEGLEHHSVQFTASAGYVMSIPCPEQYGESGLVAVTAAEWSVPGFDPSTVSVHRNGFRGGMRVVQQRVWDGRLVTVCDCGSCGTRYRLETLEMALPVIGSILEEADALEHRASIDPRKPVDMLAADWDSTVNRLRETAFRIRAGYDLEVAHA